LQAPGVGLLVTRNIHDAPTSILTVNLYKQEVTLDDALPFFFLHPVVIKFYSVSGELSASILNDSRINLGGY
jgi:hypothetical protein